MSQEALVERLTGLDTCVVSDAMDQLLLSGVPWGLRPVTTSARITASVVTMKLGADDGRIAPRHLGVLALETVARGQAIVVANAGRRDVAGWGGLLSVAAMMRGVAGIVVDGACRDVDDVRAAGLSVFARDVTPRTARGRVIEVAVQTTIDGGGIRVDPDDLVLADGSGIVFIPRARAHEVLDIACALRDRERALLERILAGHPIAEVLDRNYNAMTTGGRNAK